MKTAPSFQFYPADFIGGTMLMEPHEVGAYMRLLCYQWMQGGIPNDPKKIAKICGIRAKKIPEVLKKFAECDDGQLRNLRMEETRTEVENYRTKQAENGKKGGRPRSQAKPTENPPLSFGLSEPEPKENPNESSQTQTQTQTQNTPCVPRENPAPFDPAVWPDPREYPSVETVRQWAESVMAPAECAERWHAERSVEGWTSKRGDRPLNPDPSLLRPLFNSYATEWKRRMTRANGRNAPRNPAYNPQTATAGLKPDEIGGKW